MQSQRNHYVDLRVWWIAAIVVCVVFWWAVAYGIWCFLTM